MKKEKVIGVDILRAGAVLLIMLYHLWVCGGRPTVNFAPIQRIIALGGEIGVTLFFALSGFGIFWSLMNMEENGKIDLKLFIQKRCKRILPQYYVNIFFVLVAGTGAVYVSQVHLKNILSHVFMVHNFVRDYSGTINGVLWTMGIIVQFYVISIPLYKILKKTRYFFLLISMLFSILAKKLLYIYFLSPDLDNGFFLGRSFVVFTDLDNFAIGMFVAWLVQRKKKETDTVFWLVGTVIGVMMLEVVCKAGQVKGIHTNNISGCVFHSFLAVSLGIIMLAFTYFPLKKENPLVRILCWIAKYEYGIYIWHLIIIKNWFAANSTNIC